MTAKPLRTRSLQPPLPGSQIVLEESRRLLERQEADLDTLRGRLTFLVTGASVVSAVFGAALPDEPSQWSIGCTVVVFAAFAALLWSVLWILRPQTWEFSHELGPWIDELYTSSPPSGDELALAFAAGLNTYRRNNKPKLQRLQRWMGFACYCLGVLAAASALAVVVA